MRLSICIPTHDGRAQVLRNALESVAVQLEGTVRAGQVEICVSDNGSCDATRDIVQELRRRLGDDVVSYRRFERNRGFTANLLQAMAMARGTFCWMLGSDDRIEPGAIATVLALLTEDPEATGITVSRVRVDDAEPDVVRRDPPEILPGPDRLLLTTSDDVFRAVVLLQDYISTQIVRRDLWESAVDELGPEGVAAAKNFPHLEIMGRMILRRPHWWWLPDECIRHRVGTSSLDGPGGHEFDKYQLMSTAQRAEILRRLLGNRTPLYRRAMEQGLVGPLMLVYFKQQPRHTLASDLRFLVGLTRYHWFLRTFWLKTLPVALLPHPVVRGLARAARWIRNVPRRDAATGS